MASIGDTFYALWNPAGASRAQELPARVQDLIQRRDRQSEHLVCAVQILLAATLAILYEIAPRPPDAGIAQLATVPIALAAYILCIALRSYLVSRGPLPRWAVTASIAADMALLLGLIWSFHWTYGQPPAFSLKAPTFVYLFVFIAIRALRFDYRYVVIAGFCASFGWLLLCAAALVHSPAGTVTRSFTNYILANRILIGAEFDKIFALLTVTGILALATWRAERTLVEAVREHLANREIGRFLSHGVAEHIAGSPSEIRAGDATARRSAIMFLDIRGFTRLATSMPPERLVALLTTFHRIVIPIVRSHNGVIDKFLGDGVMITFGAARSSERPEADALSALEEILSRIETWQSETAQLGLTKPLAVNGAVASGMVVFAAIGDANRLEYTVIGDAVNLAAKLEKHNKSECSIALTPLATLETARTQGFVPALPHERRDNRRIAGVEGEMNLVCWSSSSAR